METKSMLTGGIEKNWSVSREELASASSITFYLVDYGVPADYDGMMNMYAAFEAGLFAMEPELI
ncbi:hypothetical protein HZB88_03325 [archaeon]|nr:hypothetical protein [archaeon]